jgi:hypothetical protein
MKQAVGEIEARAVRSAAQATDLVKVYGSGEATVRALDG